MVQVNYLIKQIELLCKAPVKLTIFMKDLQQYNFQRRALFNGLNFKTFFHYAFGLMPWH